MCIYTGSMENDYLEMMKMEMIIYSEVRVVGVGVWTMIVLL